MATDELTSLQSMLDDKTDASITTTIQTTQATIQSTLSTIQSTLSTIENTLFTPIDIDFVFASSLQPNQVTVHIYDVIQQRISEPIYAPLVTSTNTWTLETVPTIKWSGSNKIRLVFRIQKVAGHTGTGFDEIKLTQGGTVHYYDFYSGTPYSTPIKAQQFETNTSGFFDVDLLIDVDDVTARPSGSLFNEIAVTSDAITNADGNVLIQSRTIGGIYSQQLVYFGDHAAGTGQIAYVSTPEITLSVDINHVGLNLPIPSPENVPSKIHIDFSYYKYMASTNQDSNTEMTSYNVHVYLLIYDFNDDLIEVPFYITGHDELDDKWRYQRFFRQFTDINAYYYRVAFVIEQPRGGSSFCDFGIDDFTCYHNTTGTVFDDSVGSNWAWLRSNAYSSHLSGINATLTLNQILTYGTSNGSVHYYNGHTPSGQLLPPRNTLEHFVYYEGSAYLQGVIYIVSKQIYM